MRSALTGGVADCGEGSADGDDEDAGRRRQPCRREPCSRLAYKKAQQSAVLENKTLPSLREQFPRMTTEDRDELAEREEKAGDGEEEHDYAKHCEVGARLL